MTDSYEFEIEAKNALIKVLKKWYRIDAKQENLRLIWFGWIMGQMEAYIYCRGTGICADVTYCSKSDEMYIDVYNETHRSVFTRDNEQSEFVELPY